MKMKNRIVRMVSIAFMLALLFTLPAHASQKKNALKAYRNLLSANKVVWDTSSSWSVSSSGMSFSLAYIDGNSVPELLLYSQNVPHIAGYGFLYTYKNGKAVPVGTVNIDDKISYYKKKGVLVEVYSQQGYTTSTYVKFSGTQKEMKLKKAKNEFSGATEYYASENGAWSKIGKSAFNKALKKLVGTKKPTKVTFYKNTATNRKRKIK